MPVSTGDAKCDLGVAVAVAVAVAVSYLFDDFPFNEVNNKHGVL